MNHTYQYQTSSSPNRFWFTPDQIARCCLEYGRAKDSVRAVVRAVDGSLVVTLKLTKALIEGRMADDNLSVYQGLSYYAKTSYSGVVHDYPRENLLWIL
jgi:hypothetical protein